jgi:hypothetical protein
MPRMVGKIATPTCKARNAVTGSYTDETSWLTRGNYRM